MKQSGLPREIELKLRLPPGSRALLESSSWFAATPGQETHQVTTYFDTSDRALDRAGLTLRVRKIGATRTQTVKSRPNDQGVAANRNEWEWRIARDIPNISLLEKTPALAAAALTMHGKLERLFVTDIRRTVRLLQLEGKTVVEAAIDEGTIVSGKRRQPVSELELELKAGHVEPIYLFAADLQALVPMWISPESKATRGWHLRTGNTPTAQSTQMPKLPRSIRAAQGFHDIIAASLGHLIANISPTLRGVSEGLHEMRIALRATRAALQLFQNHLTAPTVDRYDIQLRRFALIFGTARDWDVFCSATVPAAVAELGTKELRGLRAAAEVQRRAALATVMMVIRGQEFTALILALAHWAEAGARRPSLIGDDRMEKRLLTVTGQLIRKLLIDSRSDLKTAARAVMRWSKRREIGACQELEGALRAFKAEPAFWSP